jgi:type VI secretion system protein ImpH
MTAAGLEVAVADALAASIGEVAVTVEPFSGAWAQVADDELTRLGRQASRLGQDCLVGQRVYDAAGRFRVLVGPLTAEQYQAAVSQDTQRELEELVGALVGEPLEHEIVFVLAAGAAPALRLGASRLGRDSWLGGQRTGARIEARRAA